MKFGQNFETHLTREWREQYINYERLKQMIRHAVENTPNVHASTEYEISAYYKTFEEVFFNECFNELTRVNNFYLEKLAEARRKHDTLQLQLISPGGNASAPSGSRKLMTQRQLRNAYAEFYLSLVLLQNFQTLNSTAFRKICKKYDKRLKSKAGASWLNAHVLSSAFTQLHDLQHMIDEVERLYTHFLAAGDRSRAMARLRVPPLGKPTRVDLVFRAGFTLGMFLMLVGATLLSYLRNPPVNRHLECFVRLHRGPFILVIFNFCMAANVAGWQRAGVNHVLIFGIDPRNHLQPATFLEIASSFGILWTLSMLGFLLHTQMHISDPYVFPLALNTIMLALFLNPLPMLNASARMWAVRLLGRIITAPLYNVSFADFWMAEQLTSLVICLSDYYFIARFYATCWRHNEHSWDACFADDTYMHLICYGLPFWFRIAQCLRRLCSISHRQQSVMLLLNVGKYSFTLLILLFEELAARLGANRHSDFFASPYSWCLLFSCTAATLYFYLWDMLQDFGLLRVWHGENLLLRNQLIYPKALYYIVIVEDLVLRYFWAIHMFARHHNLLSSVNAMTLAGILEIIRRFIWNYLRLENEHLNNCGQFRATREINLAPLHFDDSPQMERKMDNVDEVPNRRKTNTNMWQNF